MRGEFRGFVRERDEEIRLLEQEHNKIKRDYERGDN